MYTFIKKVIFIFLAVTFWQSGIFEAAAPGIAGNASIAEASHRGGGSSSFCQRFPSLCERLCRRNPSWCQPPTVSELPIQYMILSGVVLISLCGGMAYYIRKQKLKSFPEGRNE